MALDNADIEKLIKLIVDFSGVSEDYTSESALGESFFDYIESLDLSNKVVCFTGKFQYGTRKKCIELARSQGAVVIDDWRSDLDYMIIGNLSSTHWMYQNYGRKVEVAKKEQNRGSPVKIITEGQWFALTK